MYLLIEYVNKTENYIYDKEIIDIDDMHIDKSLFHTLQKEYGRCIGKVYRDTNNGAIEIGWVFEKKQKYSDVNEYFTMETWVTLLKDRPRIVYDYVQLKDLEGV